MENMPVTITLSLKQVNVLLASMAKMPLEAVLETFLAVKTQADKQAAEIQAGPPTA